jgi:hypothetical protein
MLVGGMILLGKEQAYPGWRALVPVGGTLLVMEAGRGAWVNRKVLSHPAVVWVGLISYPLYLFHWPALSFVHIVKGEIPKPVYLFDALAVALLLTLATYYLVERPLRHNRSRWVLPSLIAAFLACALSGILIWRGTIPPRPISDDMKRVLGAMRDRDMLHGMEWLSPGNAFICYNRIGGQGKQTLFYGDSNMQQYAPRIQNLLSAADKGDRGAIFVTVGGVLPIPGIRSPKARGGADLVRKYQEVLADDPRVDRVVIAGRWAIYLEHLDGFLRNEKPMPPETALSDSLGEFSSAIKDLVSQGKQVVVVLSIPTAPELDPKSVYFRTFKGILGAQEKPYEKKTFLREHGDVLRKIGEVARSAGAHVVDPLDFLCDAQGLCLAEGPDGVPIRYDEGHLRPGYVREQVKYLDFTVEP